MKKSYIKYFTFVISLILIFSCEDELQFNEPESILYSLVIEGESPKIFLCQTLNPFPEDSYNFLYFDQPFSIEDYNTNMNISVTCDNKVYNNFEMESQVIDLNSNSHITAISSEINYFTDKSFIPEAGKEYIIEIDEVPSMNRINIGFDYLKSKTFIPEKIPILIEQENDVINYEFVTRLSGEYYVNNYVYTLTFDDPGETDNYYYLMLSTVESRSEDFSMDTVSMDQLRVQNLSYNVTSLSYCNLKLSNIHIINGIDDYDSGSGFNGYLFNDESFNGQSKSIRLELFNFYEEQEITRYLIAELMHISKDYYNYFTSIQKQNISQNDIFAEPTQLYTNIEGGLGIFAGASINTNYILTQPKPE